MDRAMIAEGLDHLITLPVFNWDNMKAGLPMPMIYDTLRSKIGKSPLIDAAENLLRYAKKGDHIIITTGFYLVSSKTYETDGPVGAATLARAIERSTGAIPVILVGEGFVESMKHVCVAAGLLPCDVQSTKDGIHRVGVGAFPTDDGGARSTAEALLTQLNPSSIISVECPDCNSKGVYHRAKGFDVSSFQAKFPILFNLAQKTGAYTLGIGDLGNEIGMESLREIFMRIVPSHFHCKCGCGAGILGTTATRGSIIANISNWGAYGLEAALALLTGDSQTMHDPATERRVLEASVSAGYVDGALEYPQPTADGASEEVNSSLVFLLRSLVELQDSKSFLEYLI